MYILHILSYFGPYISQAVSLRSAQLHKRRVEAGGHWCSVLGALALGLGFRFGV